MKYRIKRFSKQQRDFSWISKKLDKLREEVKKNEEEIRRRLEDRDLFSPRLIGVKQESEFIENETKNSNSRLIERTDGLGPYMNVPTKKDYQEYQKMIKSGKYTEDEIALIKLLMEENKRGVTNIFWRPEDGLETLAHEIGHSLNYKEKGLKATLRKLGIKLGKNFSKMDDGVLSALLNVLGSKSIVWEEKEASKKGYELLKKYNLTPEELKIAKQNLDNALEIYKLQGKNLWRKNIINSKLNRL